MGEAGREADVIIPATGDKHVPGGDPSPLLRDGAITANPGHFNVEIDIPPLRELATSTHVARPFVEGFQFADGRTVYLLADGRLLNLSAAEGHPASVMDMSFANQALSAEHVVKNADSLEPK